MLSVQTKHQFNYLVMPLGGAERTGYTRLTYCCMVWHYLKSAALSYMRAHFFYSYSMVTTPQTNLFRHSWSLEKISNFHKRMFMLKWCSIWCYLWKNKTMCANKSQKKIWFQNSWSISSFISLIYIRWLDTATCFHWDLIDYCVNLKYIDDILTTMRQ